MFSDEPCLQGGGEVGALLRGRPETLRAWGEPADWPSALKTLIPVVLHNPQPALLWWGPELRQIHNDACSSWLGQQHPLALGAPAAHVWGDIWKVVGVAAQRAIVHRTGIQSDPIDLSMHSSLCFSCTPVFDAHSEVSGLLVAVLGASGAQLEMRERLLLERERLLGSERQARSDAEAANRAKDEFLAMLGHELRNPLSPILTALQLMRLRGEGSREQAVIERQVGHLVRLVDDLLDVSRITRGKIELRREPVELCSIVVRAVEIASPLLERRKQRLELAVPETGLIVDADSDRLAQVVANLLTNASKYSHVGAHIWVSAQALGERVWLRVRDEGVGIAPEMLQAVFGAFVQQRQAPDRASGGLGLGLAIVQSLVALHGGSVEAQSPGLGKGSEFIVELPVAGRLSRTSRPPSAAGMRALSAQPGRSLRVLVVDDNEDGADVLAEALGRLGYEVEVAHDGPSALELVQSFHPAVALLDIGLPVMDGYELAQRLLSLPTFKHRLRLIAVTGYGQAADRQRSEEAGFSAHLVKPVAIEQLTEAVEAVCANLDPVLSSPSDR